MRKVIWCGTALVVCSAVTVVLAARYAAENPDSFLGRCAYLASEMATRCNPLAAFTNMRAPQQTALVEVKPIAGDGPVIPGPEIPGQEQPEGVAGEPAEVVEPIVVDAAPFPNEIARQTNEPDTLRVEEESEVDLPIPTPKPEEDVQVNPPFMPYAADDDDYTAGQAQGNQDCAFLAQFFGWVLAGDGNCANGDACPCKAMSRAIAEFLHDMSSEEPDFGCPWTVAPSISEEAEAGTEANAYSVPVYGPMDESDSQESSEAATSPDPADANFQEDPSYHHQYPSCPYTGHCPYPYHYKVPAVQNPAPPQEKPASKPKKKKKPVVKEVSFKKDGLEYVVHPDVDTMECRPTDLPPGEAEDNGPY